MEGTLCDGYAVYSVHIKASKRIQIEEEEEEEKDQVSRRALISGMTLSKSHKRGAAIFETPKLWEGREYRVPGFGCRFPPLPLAPLLPFPPSKKGRKGIAPFRTSDIVWERVAGFKSALRNPTKNVRNFPRSAELTLLDVGRLRISLDVARGIGPRKEGTWNK